MPSQATIKGKENGILALQLKIDPNQDALYRDYKMQLQALKTKYHQEGLKVVKPRNPKKPNPRAPPQRDCHLLFCNRCTSPSLVYLEKKEDMQ